MRVAFEEGSIASLARQLFGHQKVGSLAVEVLVPSGPLVFAEVGQGSVATLVFNVQQVRAFAQDEIHQFKVGGVGPAGIVQGRAAVIVADCKRDLGFFDEKGGNFEHTLAAGHVQE